jgi:hypothetical protein
MSDKIIALAEFATLAEAHLALEYLRQHSIEGFVTDDTTNPVNFSMLGRMPYAPGIQVHVYQRYARKARHLLQSRAQEKPVKGWEKQAEEVDGWLCHLCDTYNEEDVPTCPACGEPRQANRKKK